MSGESHISLSELNRHKYKKIFVDLEELIEKSIGTPFIYKFFPSDFVISFLRNKYADKLVSSFLGSIPHMEIVRGRGKFSIETEGNIHAPPYIISIRDGNKATYGRITYGDKYIDLILKVGECKREDDLVKLFYKSMKGFLQSYEE